MNEGKSKNVIQYLDNLVEKGKATPGAIVPLKTAFSRVMKTVDKENWENTDIQTIDLDDYMLRFSNLTAGAYSVESLSAYKSRVNRTLNWYRKFLETPGWMPDVGRRSASNGKKEAGPADTRQSTKKGFERQHIRHEDQGTTETTSPAHIQYTYPLISGELIKISLPIKLSTKDAARISAFITSIAIEETPMLRDINPTS